MAGVVGTVGLTASTPASAAQTKMVVEEVTGRNVEYSIRMNVTGMETGSDVEDTDNTTQYSFTSQGTKRKRRSLLLPRKRRDILGSR